MGNMVVESVVYEDAVVCCEDGYVTNDGLAVLSYGLPMLRNDQTIVYHALVNIMVHSIVQLGLRD